MMPYDAIGNKSLWCTCECYNIIALWPSNHYKTGPPGANVCVCVCLMGNPHDQNAKFSTL